VKEDVQERTEVQYSTGVQAESDRIKGKEGDGWSLGRQGRRRDAPPKALAKPRSKGRTRRRSEQAWVTKALATSKAWVDTEAWSVLWGQEMPKQTTGYCSCSKLTSL